LATGGRVAESAFSRVRIGAAASAAQEYILPHIQPIGVALDQGNS